MNKLMNITLPTNFNFNISKASRWYRTPQFLSFHFVALKIETCEKLSGSVAYCSYFQKVILDLG